MMETSGERRGVWSSLAILLGWGLTAVGSGFVLLHAVPGLQMLNWRAALLAAFIPLGTVAWALAVALFGSGARGWRKAVALVPLCGLVVQLVWLAPYLPGAPPSSASEPGRDGVTLMTLNSRCDGSDSEELAEVLGELRPDLVVLQGAEDRIQESLAEAGMHEVYPHRLFFPMPTLPFCGTAVYSGTPVVETPASTARQPAVRVAAAGGEFALVPADVPGPQGGVAEWESAIAGLGAAAEVHAAAGWPVIVAGDFNAVREHLPFRRLVGEYGGRPLGDGGPAASSGLVNAAEVAGAGWLPTYRADRWFPPLLEIDHVLVSPGIEVREVETVRVGGHAHLALLARVDVR